MSLSQREIARLLEISPARVNQMVKKGCPTDSIAAVWKWRAEHLTPQAKTTKVGADFAAMQPAAAPQEKNSRIDLADKSPFDVVAGSENFDESMMIQAAEVLNAAFILYRVTVENQRTLNLNSTLKNWTEAAKSVAALRERFLRLQQENRQLISLDEADHDMSEEVVEWKRLFVTLADRLAGRVPAEYLQVINEEIDSALKNMDRSRTRLKQLFEGKPDGKA